MPAKIRSYAVCRDCGQLIRPGRLDVHKYCRPVPRSEGPTLADLHETPGDRPPVRMASPPCGVPAPDDNRNPTEEAP